jgi:hypothetical protein
VCQESFDIFLFLSRRYTTNEAEESDRNIIQIDPDHRWLHDVSLEGDDKRSPLLSWLQDAQDAEQDNAGGTSRHHGCNSRGLPSGHDGMQITIGVMALHLAHTLPPSHKVCGHETL